MKLKVFTPDGGSSTEKDFAGLPEFEADKGLLALKQYLVAYQANQRLGTASTKNRAEVSGTGKKPFRQKGTGSARQGTRRANFMRGGGVAHGPKPRVHRKKVNRKMRHVAFARALYDRAVAGEVAVIERFEIARRKTRLVSAVVDALAPAGSVLLVDDGWSADHLYAARNLVRVSFTEAGTLNAYDLCRYDRIIITESGLEKVIARGAPAPVATATAS